MNRTSSQLWYFAPWGWEDPSLPDIGPSYSFVLEKLSHFSSRGGSFRERPRSSPVGGGGAREEPQENRTKSHPKPCLSLKESSRKGELERHEQGVCELNGFPPPPLWEKKKNAWHLRNKLLKCEIMRQGKLSQRIRN